MNKKTCFGMAIIIASTSMIICAQETIVTGRDNGEVPHLQMPVYSVPVEKGNSFYDDFIKGRLHIGLSFTSLSMDETSTPHEKAYLGNLDTLREDDTENVGFTVKYDFCRYLAMMFSYDVHAELSAWNWGSASSDGSLELDGWTLQAIGQYPLDVADGKVVITPYVGLGFSDISAKWEYANWWHWGYGSPEDWAKRSNNVQAPNNGYSRWMNPEDPSTAFTYTLGLSFQFFEHLDIDVFYRLVDLDDIKTTFHAGAQDGKILGEGAFPAKFSALGVALRYVF